MQEQIPAHQVSKPPYTLLLAQVSHHWSVTGLSLPVLSRTAFLTHLTPPSPHLRGSPDGWDPQPIEEVPTPCSGKKPLLPSSVQSPWRAL